MDFHDFHAHQMRRRRELWKLLGPLPTERMPTAELLDRQSFAAFEIEHLRLDLNGIEPAEAYLLLPRHRVARAPAMLYCHAHGGTYEVGKEELLRGNAYMQPYAEDLARLGIVTLVVDAWCFSSRRHHPIGRVGETDTFKQMLWHGRCLFGMMLFDQLQALAYLRSRAEVDPERVGVMGLSMGATKAWWLAALEPDLRLCVDLCCLTDFEELIRTGNLEGHGVYYYVPGLLKHFQSAQINELIAPRPRLSLNGRFDPLTPPAGVEKIRDHLMPLYRQFGSADDCRIELFEVAHQETLAMRQIVLEWLVRHLAGLDSVISH